MIVLSHGDESKTRRGKLKKKHQCDFPLTTTGGIYASDGKISAQKLYEPFKGDTALSLAGKPKIFITQACRGDSLDHGVDLVVQDAADNATFQRIPREADFLYSYSTVPGYYSWRNTEHGSWYAQVK